MNAYTRTLKQNATYWPPIANDAFGAKIVSNGIAIKVRWENKSVYFRSVDNREDVSQAIVYTNENDEVLEGGKLSLGDYSGQIPPSNESVFEVRQVNKSPSLKGTYNVVKAIL